MKFQLDRPRLRWGGMRMRPGEDLAISLVRKWRPPFLPFFCSRRDSFSILQRSQTAPHRVSSVLIETVIIISPIDYRRVRSVCVCVGVCVWVCVSGRWALGLDLLNVGHQSALRSHGLLQWQEKSFV